MQWSSQAVKAFIDENNRVIQTYCLVILAMFAIGSLMLTLSSVILPLLFALFLSLHFSPLIELLKCQRGPRRCRECNQPCRRTIKDRLMICKGPDNEYDKNCFNSCVRASVDLFCGFKFPSWLAILTTFGVIVAFFAIIGLIVSDSVDGLLQDRDKWARQWNTIVAEVVAFAVAQGVTITTTDVNNAASDFAIQNILNPLTAILPLAITYTFLTLVFLVFVLVSPSTFFGDPDAIEATDPDELSCSDADVNDDHIAAAVDNVITAQAAAMLAEEDDEDDGLLGDSLVAKVAQPRSAIKGDQRANTLGPGSSAWLAAATMAASSAGTDPSASRGPRRRTMTDRRSKRRMMRHEAGMTSSGRGTAFAAGDATGHARHASHNHRRHGRLRPASAKPTVSPETLRQWQLDLERSVALTGTGDLPEPPAGLLESYTQPDYRSSAGGSRSAAFSPERHPAADKTAHPRGHHRVDGDVDGEAEVRLPGTISSPGRDMASQSSNRQHRSGSQGDAAGDGGRSRLAKMQSEEGRSEPARDGGNRDRIASAGDAQRMAEIRPGAFVEAAVFDSDGDTANTEPGHFGRESGQQSQLQGAKREARTSTSDRAIGADSDGRVFLRGAGVAAAWRERGEVHGDDASDSLGTAPPTQTAGDHADLSAQRGSAWAPPGGDAPPVMPAADDTTTTTAPPNPATSGHVNWAEVSPSGARESSSAADITGPDATKAVLGSPGHADASMHSSPTVVVTRGIQDGPVPVAFADGSQGGGSSPSSQRGGDGGNASSPSPTMAALSGQGSGAGQAEGKRGRAASSLMHTASKVLEVVGFGTVEGSTSENDDTEDEFPLEYISAQQQQELLLMHQQHHHQHGHLPLDAGAMKRQQDLNNAANNAMDENRRRLRAWAKRQKRKGRYPDSAEATAVMLHQKAQNRVTRYIVVHTWLSAATGLGVGISLLAISAPLPALFGLLTFVLNFIPSVGSWIAMMLPIPFILFDPDSGVTTLVLAILLPGFMQVALGNFVEPALLGKLCKVDPIVILVSILLFGFVWGIAGMVLAVPMVVIIKLVFKQMAHPIPRYIAGIIVGNLYRYRARLDRDVRRRIRYARLLRAAETAYQTAEGLGHVVGSMAGTVTEKSMYHQAMPYDPQANAGAWSGGRGSYTGGQHAAPGSEASLPYGHMPQQWQAAAAMPETAPYYPYGKHDSKSSPIHLERGTGLHAELRHPPTVAQEGVRQRWTRGSRGIAPEPVASDQHHHDESSHYPHRPSGPRSGHPPAPGHPVQLPSGQPPARVRVASSSLFDDDMVMDRAVAQHEMALRAAANGRAVPSHK